MPQFPQLVRLSLSASLVQEWGAICLSQGFDPQAKQLAHQDLWGMMRYCSHTWDRWRRFLEAHHYKELGRWAEGLARAEAEEGNIVAFPCEECLDAALWAQS